MGDHYTVLGVTQGAEDVVIRAAARALIRKYHPDVNRDEGAAKRFGEVCEAIKQLGDPELRSHYDRARSSRVPRISHFQPDPRLLYVQPIRRRRRIAYSAGLVLIAITATTVAVTML